MAKKPSPQTVTVDGQVLVNRAWMADHAGASLATVHHWYSARASWPEDLKPPQKVRTINRVDFYDQGEFTLFYTGWQQHKKSRIEPADPALHEGDPEEWVSINDAAKWFHFAGPAVIRKYLGANPGYFPDPVGTVEGPSGRPIPAFRRSDLQQFDKRRRGDTTGAAGRPPGTGKGRPPSAEVAARVEIARAYLEETGGWHRGVGAELAARHDDPAWKWERAIKQARAELEAGQPDGKDGTEASA